MPGPRAATEVGKITERPLTGSPPVTSAAVEVPPRHWALAFALGLFFVSGFAALLYQVIWQRLLVIFLGADIYSITIIVGAFMAGLGIGNLAGGHIADRLTVRGQSLAVRRGRARRGSVRAAQQGDLLRPALYKALVSFRVSRGRHRPVRQSALADVLHGSVAAGSCPGADAKRLGSRDGGRLAVRLEHDGGRRWRARHDVVAAPATGTRGCAAGWRDAERCVRGWGGVACLAHSRYGAGVPAALLSSRPRARLPRHRDRAFSFPVWALVYGVTGFAALALEIAWFRLLGVMLKSTAFTFGTMLAVYLAGLGLGAAIGAWLVTRSRRPGATFLALQVVLLMVTGLSIAALVGNGRVGKARRVWRSTSPATRTEVDGAVREIHEFFTGLNNESGGRRPVEVPDPLRGAPLRADWRTDHSDGRELPVPSEGDPG